MEQDCIQFRLFQSEKTIHFEYIEKGEGYEFKAPSNLEKKNSHGLKIIDDYLKNHKVLNLPKAGENTLKFNIKK